MHKNFKIYYFIDKFNSEEIESLDKKISIIYRVYNQKYDQKTIGDIKKLCDKQKRKFFISNNLKLAKIFNLSGVYIPSFNKLDNFKNITTKKQFEILGSAHNLIQLKHKEKQGCNEVFIAPIFKTGKSSFFLDTVRFNLISRSTKKSLIALGGINYLNIKKLKLVNCEGLASISWIKKNRPKKIGRFNNFKSIN